MRRLLWCGGLLFVVITGGCVAVALWFGLSGAGSRGETSSASVQHLGFQTLSNPSLHDGKTDGKFADGAAVSVDLSSVSVFDCRHDCLRDVRDALPSLGREDKVCVWSDIRDARLVVFKLWVNRASC